MAGDNTFQERAEKLSKDEVLEWSRFGAKDLGIIKRLQSNSTRLLIGPRGSGKSMLMRWAYFSCLKDRTVLPMYINFEKYLHLEPLLHQRSNGNVLFAKWVLAKIALGAIASLQELDKFNETEFSALFEQCFDINLPDAFRLVNQLEGGTACDSRFDEVDLSVGSVLDFVSRLVTLTERNRAILLLDDAAHAGATSKRFF